MRFERLRKEPAWDLSVNCDSIDGGSAVKTPNGRKSKATKNTPKKGGDDDDEDAGTPSKKKSALNKVADGRVQKTPNGDRGRKPTSMTYQEDEDEEVPVKEEDETFADAFQDVHENGNGISYQNGYEQAEEYEVEA